MSKRHKRQYVLYECLVITRLRQDSTFVAEAATSAEQVAPCARPP